MTLKERDETIEVFFNQALTLIKSKGKDYNPSTDEAFKDLFASAESLGLTPYQLLGVYMDKHYLAIKSFIKKGQLESEPIEGRLMDMTNYCALLHVLVLKDLEEKAQNIQSSFFNQPFYPPKSKLQVKIENKLESELFNPNDCQKFQDDKEY